MFLTRLAVERPVTTLMASLIVVLLGWVALTGLPVDLLPDLTYPTVSVTTLYPGASPEEVEKLVTRPLEHALSSVNGVERLASSSTEGSCTVRVRMQWGTNLDGAVANMRQAIQKIRQSRALPDGVEEPYIQYYDVADQAIMYLGVSSELESMPLSRLAETQIVPALEKLNGVARVRLRGDVRREIQVDLDRNKLEALNMGVNEIITALDRGNVNQPAGDYDEGDYRRIIRSHGEFRSLEDIRDTVVRRGLNGVVRIRDVAEVVDGEEERTELTRVDGRAGLLVYVYKQAGANTIDVSDRVHEEVQELNGRLKGVALNVRIDKSEFIREAIANVKTSALYGMGLAVVVLIVFLRSFRSTLVIGVAMPLSVLATFVLIYFKGFTLNMVSFGGLALGIGLLVDNSIVVLESIFRKREEGLPIREAAVAGTEEVAGAIVASTLTTLIVFLPFLFVTGVTGVLLHQLAWVVSFSLLCSLLASLTLTPVLTAYWIGSVRSARIHAGNAPSVQQPGCQEQPGCASPPISFPSRSLGTRGMNGGATNMRWLVGGMHSLSRRALSLLEGAYRRCLVGSLRHAGMVSAVLLACLTTTIGLVPRIGSEFVPQADEGDLRIDNQMSPGIQLATLDQQTRLIEQTILAHVPEALSTATFVGDEIEDADAWHTSRFRIRLVRRSERERGVDVIRKELAERIGPIPGMKVRVQAANDMMVFRMLSQSGGGSAVQVEVRGHDLQTGEELADVLAERMKGIVGLVNIRVEKEDRRPELAASIDRQKASALGVSVSDIAQTLETTIRGSHATVFREEGEEYRVLVRLRKRDRRREQDVELVSVATPSGRVVPLKNVVAFANSESPMVIQRLDQQRVINISADVEDRDLGSTVADLEENLAAVALPEGFSVNVAGDWEEQQKSFRALSQGLVLAVVLMYMVMASQFESLRDPLLILVTIPLGAVGVIVVLVFTNTTLNVQSYIGLVMLAGIVVNNAIVLVDYMNRLRVAEPQTPLDEIITRGAVRRFRPILMTTLTTVLAMLPIALGWGEGGELQAPMARVVIGGLTSGTLITLIAIPLAYRAFAGNRE